MRALRNIAFKGVLLGVLFEFVASLIISFATGIVLSYSGFSTADAADYMNSGTMLSTDLAISAVLLVGAGWIAGQFSRRSGLLNGGVAGAVSLLIGLPFLTGHPWWYGTSIIVMAVPAGILGGYLSKKWRF